MYSHNATPTVWVDEIESFYCHLNTCGFEQQYEYGKNTTKYTCQNIDCRCIKDEFLCGKDGSIDLTGKHIQFST